MNQITRKPYKPPARSRIGRTLAIRRQEVSLSSLLSANTKKMGQGCRVSGIYAEGDKYRVVVYWPKRKSIWCYTREEAEQIKAKLEEILRTQGTRTIGEALNEYLENLSRAGRKASSVGLVSRRLVHFLPFDLRLGALTAEAAAELYRAETDHRDPEVVPSPPRPTAMH